jgi:gluconolactonase
MQWKFELLMKPTAVPLTEGPVWDGEHVYFTHIRASRIMRYDPKSGAIAEARTRTNRTNGLAFDAQGRLFGCCSGGRSILRFDPDGRNVTIADRVEGKKLNTPNDLAIDRKGRIWFTNPWNEGNIDATERTELDNKSVLRADPQTDGSYTVKRVTFDTTMPNGILVSQDQSTLYVAESGYAKGIMRELRAYPIRVIRL